MLNIFEIVLFRYWWFRLLIFPDRGQIDFLDELYNPFLKKRKDITSN